jgi:hypothetical protein
VFGRDLDRRPSSHRYSPRIKSRHRAAGFLLRSRTTGSISSLLAPLARLRARDSALAGDHGALFLGELLCASFSSGGCYLQIVLAIAVSR